MESSASVLYKIDSNALESKSELEAVYFTKPRLVAYYEQKYNVLDSAKKIYYFKKPKPQDYPINLNTSLNNGLKFISQESLRPELKYAMSSVFKKNVNLKKIKIFVSQWCLNRVMNCYYRKIGAQEKIRVSRYNSDLYILLSNENCYSDANNNWQQQSGHCYEFRKNVFAESLYYDPNITGPDRSRLRGVYHGSFGEFEIIYSGVLDGIQAEEEFNDFDDVDDLNNCRWVITHTVKDSDLNDPLNYLSLWLRAYLSNATDIYLANVNPDGILTEPVDHEHIFELPKDYKADWKPRICTGFLHKFLQEINTLMTNDNVNSLNTVYKFYINEDNTVAYKIFKDKTKNFVVTPEYMEYCKKQTSN